MHDEKDIEFRKKLTNDFVNCYGNNNIFSDDCKNYKKKVYCGDCKYYKFYISWVGLFVEICKCKKNIIIENNPIQKEKDFLQEPKEINKNNDCKNYKRKWWKIWV